jgi:hypothetical protein
MLNVSASQDLWPQLLWHAGVDCPDTAIHLQRKVDDSYANGYGNSNGPARVLLREANDLCGPPVAVDEVAQRSSGVGVLRVNEMRRSTGAAFIRVCPAPTGECRSCWSARW